MSAWTDPVLDAAAKAAFAAYERHAGFPSGPWERLSEQERDVARAQAKAVVASVGRAIGRAAARELA